MEHKDINYTRGKIFQALQVLALDEGNRRFDSTQTTAGCLPHPQEFLP